MMRSILLRRNWMVRMTVFDAFMLGVLATLVVCLTFVKVLILQEHVARIKKLDAKIENPFR